MTEQEFRAKYQPRELETQAEFDALMQLMRQEQTNENYSYIDRLDEIAKQHKLLDIQRWTIKQQMHALSIERIEIETKQREINRAYYDIKHQFCVLNPKEKFINQE